jgi:hypothetical protein
MPGPATLTLRAAFTLGCLLILATPSASASPDEEVAAFEARLDAGLAARDRQRLEPLLATGFQWVHASDGRVDDRDGWLANAARGMALTGQRAGRSEHGVSLTLHGDTTAIRTARVRLVDAARRRETWIRQTHTLVRHPAGQWQLAMGQGVIMYDGPELDPGLHARYAGSYRLDDGRALELEWRDASLLAVLPNGARTQVFLASPTEEASRTPAAGLLRFALAADGSPREAALIRGSETIWRAKRR